MTPGSGRLVGILPWACAVLGGCRIGASPREVPLLRRVDGPLLVLAVHDGTDQPDVAAALLAATGPALAGRGYYVVPPDVGLDLLARRGLARDRPRRAEDVAATVRGLGVAAMVEVEVRRWRAVWAPSLLHLEYDVSWRIVDAASRETVWAWRARDRWSWEAELPVLDHDQVLGLYLGRRLEGGRQSPFRSVLDVARQMACGVLGRLPRGSAARRRG